MSGNPAAGLYIAIIFCLAFIYGFLIINIVIGLFLGLFCLCRHICIDKELKERNMKLCGAAFLSMLPIIGPLWALHVLTN